MVLVSRWSLGKKNETERYLRALDVLGELRAHKEKVARANPSKQPQPRSDTQVVGQVPPMSPQQSGTSRSFDSRTREDLARAGARLVFVDEELLGDASEKIEDKKTSYFARRRSEKAFSPRRRYRHVMSAAVIALVGTTIGLTLSGSLSTHPSRAIGQKVRRATSASKKAPPTITSTPKSASVPTMYSLTPAVGSAGETVTVSGSGFLSANGSIVATFGSQIAPTSCPTENQCFVTVPPGSNSAVVRIRTESGTSNPLTFRYG